VAQGRSPIVTTVRIPLPVGTMAVPAARRHVIDVLTDWDVPDRVRENVELVVSELVGNAVEHGGGTAELVLSLSDDVLRVDVVDPDPRLPVMRSPAAGDDRHRGLLIVAALSSDWGTDRTEAGKSVWAELPCGIMARIEVVGEQIGPEISRDRIRPVREPAADDRSLSG
jgi:anti-sigma regulatory factor (Ser/Thr protein kinase)